ncbi:hypothetical protein EGI22_23120 [Lacihabitans sp. LS3-19]|uniref:hypothetical protein n=1 Tax=Lacihabitans sp. LS3-19 TaxID=2487335 RepID=UPI0020CC5617|nr:hypothetical protein [Lacihabitans sp. LS3-19]MCP9770806.1 hypothetical protein [Lacihabitans sp. LS3-19]
MTLQFIKDSKGNNTGVFIPIEEWNALSKENEVLKNISFTENDDISNSFELSEKQISLLDEASLAPKERFLTLTQLKEKLEIKYGLSL